MKYKPGSFSKNFAWHGTGLRKLHTVIRSGFEDKLASVGRQQFRDNSGLDEALSLIPTNFFLHNRAGQISVDELIFQAIEHDHSIRFDRLGLFALHLNRAGSGQRVVGRPAMWANEFVRERLWSSGAWRSSTLDDASLDPFLVDHMDAVEEVRVKCRNNYRYLFSLCDFWPPPLSIINSGAEQWIASALFLAWDRQILEGGGSDRISLLSTIESDELYKLLGVGREYTIAQAGDLADLYISVGRLNRFRNAATAQTVAIPPPTAPFPDAGTEKDLAWLEQEESDEIVERRYVARQEQQRDRKKAAALKQRYDNCCMFCGARLQVAEDRFYSEAAHIKGIGEPHNGPDKVSNMLVLCPNHHLQFDRGILRLEKVGSTYRIKSKTAGDPLQGRTLNLAHSIDDDCVKYHHDWFRSTRA